MWLSARSIGRFAALPAAALLLVSVVVFVAGAAGPAPAQAAETSSTTQTTSAPGAATATTGTGQTGLWPTTTSVPAGQTGTSPTATPGTPSQSLEPAPAGAVIPPPAGWAPLNPGWRSNQVDVRIWPEYDQKAVLAIVTLTLPADVPLPATLKFAVPTGARITGIGEIDPNGNFKYNYETTYPPVTPGTEWDIVTIDVKNYRQLQIDYYYDPGLPQGAGDRSFPLLVQIPVDAGTLLLHVQHPAGATGFAVDPAFQGTGGAGDGFTYSVAAYPEVKAGSTLGHVVSYYKPNGSLSVDAEQPSSSTQFNTNTMLLTVILAIVIIVGALVLYRLFFSNRGPSRRGGGSQPRSALATASAGGKKQRQTANGATAPAKASAKPPAGRSTAAKPVATAAPRKAVAQKAGTAAPTASDAASAGPAAGVDAASPGPAAATPETGGLVDYCVACGEELTSDPFCPHCGEARS